jgi:hypothetical protein
LRARLERRPAALEQNHVTPFVREVHRHRKADGTPADDAYVAVDFAIGLASFQVQQQAVFIPRAQLSQRRQECGAPLFIASTDYECPRILT